jgi:hypothetical protein
VESWRDKTLEVHQDFGPWIAGIIAAGVAKLAFG